MNDAEILVRYEEARNNPQLQAELQGDLGYKTYGSVRDRVSNIKRSELVVSQIIHQAKKHRNRVLKDCGKILELWTGAGHKTMIDMGDAHNPYADNKLVGMMVEFCKEFQPDYFNDHGDGHDFYQISKFNKDPERANDLQKDLKIAKASKARFREAMPNAIFIEEEGNHEARLRRFLWSNAPALASLDCLDIRELIGLRELEIDYAPADKIIKVNGVFKLEHGDIVRQFAGYTARAMLLKRGGCGMVGHTHRMGSSLKTVDGDTYGWWENGCLCQLDPEYTKAPDWQHGFSVIHFIGDIFHVEQVPIIHYKFVYGGRLYG